jgi:hypothetical protein
MDKWKVSPAAFKNKKGFLPDARRKVNQAGGVMGNLQTIMIKSIGTIFVSSGRIVCNVSYDLVGLYRQLIHWEFPNLIGGLSFPRHGAHITIAQPKLHVIDQAKAWRWHQKKVEFYYDTNIYIGGFRKGFVGFYTKIESEILEKIKKEVIVKEITPGSLHLSICNSKALSNVC